MKNRLARGLTKTGVRPLSEILPACWKSILCTVIIIILSFLPGKTFEKVDLFDISFMDLVVHFFMYAGLTLVILWEQSGKIRRDKTIKSWWKVPLLITAILGLITEIIQGLLITGRNGSIADFFLNMCGSVAVLLLYRFFR